MAQRLPNDSYLHIVDRIMASNQPHTKRDSGGDKPAGKSKDGNPAKAKPGAPSEGGGPKGKNDSGGNT
jgi:hypothetical protein